jgi:hypothetical protein
MAWIRPQNDKPTVARAGKELINPGPNIDIYEAVKARSVASNWRSAHAYPLHILYKNLKKRAETINPACLVVKRLKRMPSIIDKLRRFNFKLSEIQDLGGCRAVLDTPDQVHALAFAYEKRPFKTAEFKRKTDYIQKPKPDGYRSIHLIYRYQSKNENTSIYNGLQIEIQIRTQKQHAWATAVEIIDTFKNKGLKSGRGDSSWSRFFILVSSFIAMTENSPRVPGTPDTAFEWFSELKALCTQLDVISVLEGIRAGMKTLVTVGTAPNYILVLNSKERTTHVSGFPNEEAAAERYQIIEQDTANRPEIHAVMVSADSLDNLRNAYPNYYMDTSFFIGLLKDFMEVMEKMPKQPSDDNPSPKAK